MSHIKQVLYKSQAKVYLQVGRYALRVIMLSLQAKMATQSQEIDGKSLRINGPDT